MKTLLIFYLIALSLYSCVEKEPVSFSTFLANVPIRFPVKAYELDSTKYHLPYFRSNKYVDSSENVKIEWLIDERSGDHLRNKIDNRTIYGVNIYLKNKGSQIDSVKSALEKQFGKKLNPVTIEETKDEQFSTNFGYSCQLNQNTTLFLRNATCEQGDSWCQYNSLRIGIGYNLRTDQLERLATTDSKIYKSYD